MSDFGPRASALRTKDFDVQVAGNRLRVRLLAPGPRHRADSPTHLVFLHEGLGSIAQWRDFPEALVRATGLPAMLYDRLGHGESAPFGAPRPPHYLEEEARDTLPRLLEACGIPQPLLLGHSDGATLALLFAAEFPRTPRAVIAEAAHVFLEELTLAGIRHAAEAFREGRLRKGLLPFHGSKVDALFRAWSETWLAPSHRDWDITPCLSAIQAPVLMIQGEEDPYGSTAQIQAVLSRVSGPSEGWLLPGCGHAPHHQAREAVLARVAHFIRALPR
jgi:pimeloyl-ACP methyl ester carboxylesterase